MSTTTTAIDLTDNERNIVIAVLGLLGLIAFGAFILILCDPKLFRVDDYDDYDEELYKAPPWVLQQVVMQDIEMQQQQHQQQQQQQSANPQEARKPGVNRMQQGAPQTQQQQAHTEAARKQQREESSSSSEMESEESSGKGRQQVAASTQLAAPPAASTQLALAPPKMLKEQASQTVPVMREMQTQTDPLPLPASPQHRGPAGMAAAPPTPTELEPEIVYVERPDSPVLSQQSEGPSPLMPESIRMNTTRTRPLMPETIRTEGTDTSALVIYGGPSDHDQVPSFHQVPSYDDGTTDDENDSFHTEPSVVRNDVLSNNNMLTIYEGNNERADTSTPKRQRRKEERKRPETFEDEPFSGDETVEIFSYDPKESMQSLPEEVKRFSANISPITPGDASRLQAAADRMESSIDGPLGPIRLPTTPPEEQQAAAVGVHPMMIKTLIPRYSHKAERQRFIILNGLILVITVCITSAVMIEFYL